MELNDLSNAIGTINQSFFYKGLVKPHHAAVSGAGFIDSADQCDCSSIIQPKPAVKRDYGNMTESGD